MRTPNSSVLSIVSLALFLSLFSMGWCERDSLGAVQDDMDQAQLLQEWQQLNERQRSYLSEGRLGDAADVGDAIEKLLVSIREPDRFNVAYARGLNATLKRVMNQDVAIRDAVAAAMKEQHEAEELRRKGDIVGCVKLHYDSFNVLSKQLGDKNEIVDQARALLSERYRDVGLLENARLLYEGIGEYRRAAHGSKSPAYAACLTAHGIVLFAEGKPRDAEVIVRKALDIRRRLDARNRAYFQCQIILARINIALGRHAEGEALVLDALKNGDFGLLADEDRALALLCLGQVAYEYGDNEHAKDRFQNALVAIRRANLAQSREAADILDQLASCMRALGKPDAGFAYAVEAQEIRLRTSEAAKAVTASRAKSPKT